ncbi:hypothetical protein B4900_00130 [Yersinia rohdei]|nr:hypothetical protein B4900_00130 [Yersinia rohdei]
MSGLALIEQLNSDLSDVAEQRNWDRMPMINGHIDKLVAFLRQQYSVPPAVEQAMQQLQSRYQLVYQEALLHQMQLKESIAQLRQDQPGVAAYAAMAISAYQDMAQEEGRR